MDEFDNITNPDDWQEYTNAELIECAEVYIGGTVTTTDMAVVSIACSMLVLARNSEEKKRRWWERARTK